MSAFKPRPHRFRATVIDRHGVVQSTATACCTKTASAKALRIHLNETGAAYRDHGTEITMEPIPQPNV